MILQVYLNTELRELKITKENHYEEPANLVHLNTRRRKNKQNKIFNLFLPSEALGRQSSESLIIGYCIVDFRLIGFGDTTSNLSKCHTKFHILLLSFNRILI